MDLHNLLLPNSLEFADVSRPNPLRFSDQRLNLPQSAQAINIERNTPAADGSTMDYELISVDPAYLIGAPIRPGSFTWWPGRAITEFGCTIWE